MKRIFNILIIIMFFCISSVSFASDSDETFSNYSSVNPIANVSNLSETAVDGKCAVVSYSGDEYVNPRDFTVCENDISYSILEIIFHKVFSENEILRVLVEKETDSSDVAYAFNIGGPIIAIIEAVTFFTLTVGSLFFAYITLKTLNLSASSGKFMKDWNSVYVITRTVSAIILIVPIGSFSIAQIIILIFSIFAIMGANYIWGAFLSMQQANTQILNLDEQAYYNQALDQAESISLIQSCSMRSASASLEANQKNHDGGFLWFDMKSLEQITRVGMCSRNAYYMSVDEENFENGQNTYPFSRLLVGSPENCSGDMDSLNKYDEEFYGGFYSCGEVNFTVPNLASFSEEVGEDLDFWNDMEDKVTESVSSFKSSFNIDSFYTEIKEKSDSIGDVAFDSDNYEDEIETLKAAIVSNASPVFDLVVEKLDTPNENPPLAFDGLYITTNAIFAALMGGSYDNAGYSDFLEQLLSLKINLSTASLEYKKLIQITQSEEESLRLHPLYNTSKEVALLLMSAHCARNWQDYVSKYDTTKNYLDEIGNNPGESFKDINGSISSNCLAIINKETSDTSLSAYYTPLFGNLDTEFVLTLAGDSSSITALQTLSDQPSSDYAAIYETASTDIIQYSESQARKLILGMTAYFYVVRTATSRAMEEMYQVENNNEVLINMRDLGWASAGGFILSLANSGSNVTSHTQLIQDSVNYNHSVSNYKFVISDLENSDNGNFEFLTMQQAANNIFQTPVTDFSDYTPSGSTEKISLDSIGDILEDMITSPMRHLKSVGGFDQNKTLREGAEACYEEGDCSITNIHPVTALMQMGNEIIDLSAKLIFAKLITSAITYFTAGGSNAKVKKAASAVKAFTGPLGLLLISAVELLDLILGFIVFTILPPLFIVGVFFSFVIPMMPFLAFLMGFIGWVMLILELLIAVNVWVIMMATPDANGTSRADPRAIFNFAGQLLLKPGLMVIGLIFGWYLSAISIYFLNLTIFGALSPTETGSFFGLFDIFMFYVVYLIMIFVAVKHSFKIIEILPDKIFGLLNINKSGDIKSESLGMERLIQIAAGKQVFDMSIKPSQVIDGKKKEIKEQIEAEKRERANYAASNALKSQAEDAEKDKALKDSVKENSDSGKKEKSSNFDKKTDKTSSEPKESSESKGKGDSESKESE